MSFTPPPCSGRPSKKSRRRKLGCARRSAVRCATKRIRSLLSLARRPVEPVELVVLAVGVVVALLAAPELVAREQHRRALRQQQGGEEVAPLARAQLEDRRVVGRALDAAVPGQVVVVAVAVVLAVGLVVLVVVGHQVGEREAVVGGDEVDAGVRPPPGAPVQVGRAGEAARELADLAAVALPVGAHAVAIAVVPLRPAEREVAHLVAAVAEVPGLGDQLDAVEHRVLAHHVEEGAQRSAPRRPRAPARRRGRSGSRRRASPRPSSAASPSPAAARAGASRFTRVAAAGDSPCSGAGRRARGCSRRRCRCRARTASARGGCLRSCGCRPRR